MGKPLPSSATSSDAVVAVALPGHGDVAGAGVLLDVGERLLGDAEHLTLLEQRQPARLLAAQDDVEAGPLPDPLEIEVEDGEHVLGLRHVGAQVVEGVAHLADDVADVGAELLERAAHVARPVTRS